MYKDDPEVPEKKLSSNVPRKPSPLSATKDSPGSLLGPHSSEPWVSLIHKVQKFKATKDSTTAPSPEGIPKQPSVLTVSQLQQAETIILKTVQTHSFREEIQALENAQTDHTATINRRSPLSKLSPFLDSDGILRVGGRLKRSEMDLATRHPIVLPKDSHVSELLAYHYHCRVQHQGRQLTTGAIRSAGL